MSFLSFFLRFDSLASHYSYQCVSVSESDIQRSINPEIPIELHPGLVASMKTIQSLAPEELETITNAGDKLVKAEFIAGLVGTLIWGFGDLIKYLPIYS